MNENDLAAAQRFRDWLRERSVGLDDLVRVAPGVSRATLSALMGTNGTATQARWDGLRRGTLGRVLTGVNAATGEKLTARQLGEIVGADLSRPVWAEV